MDEQNNQVENIREHIKLIGADALNKTMAELPLSNLLDQWEVLPKDEQIKIFLHLNLDDKVDLINSLSYSSQESLITALSAENTKILLEEMEPDDLADFIQHVSQKVRESVWNSLSDEAKQETQMLLRFDEDDAAGIMTPRYLAIASSLSISQALAWVRKRAANVETIYNIYVVDQLKRLRGVISLKDIISSADDELVENVMVKKVVSVREYTDQEEAAKMLETYDLITLPVVDQYSRLLGIITFDDVIDVIREEQTEDVYKMGAMSGKTERYLGTSVFGLIKKRIPWLSILLLAATFTTNVLAYFEHLFMTAAVLTLFIPTIIGTGGNSGTQSSTLIIRGLATGELKFRDLGRVLAKEILVGICIGILMAGLIIIRSLILPPNISLLHAITVGISLACVVIVASLVGAIFPLIIHKIGLDPAVAAGPFMSTIIDIAGLTIYFLTAKILLGL